MTYARVDVDAVLDAAQTVIDRHVTNPDQFGRCLQCGTAWPCAARARAGASFYRAARLPRRGPTKLIEATTVRWSPVDWFGTGTVTTTSQGRPAPRAWKLRRSAA